MSPVMTTLRGRSPVRRVLWACTLGCVGLQLIVALLMLWSIVELSTYGEISRRPTYTWTGLLLPLATAAGAMVAASAAWRARRTSGPLLRLVASQGVMLAAAVALSIALQRAAGPSRVRAVLLQPGSRLPPNEIFGSEWPLGMIVALLLCVGALAVPGLVLSVLLGVVDWRQGERPT